MTQATPARPSPTQAAGPPAAFYQPTDYRPDDSVGYLMRRTLNLMASGVDSALHNSDLTHAQWLPLLKLHRGCGQTVAELARECAMDTGAMTRLLDRLEGKGLVRRQRCTRDRRVVQLALTDAGQAAAAQIPHALCAVQNACLSGFSADEWQQLRSLLARMLQNAHHLVNPSHDT